MRKTLRQWFFIPSLLALALAMAGCDAYEGMPTDGAEATGVLVFSVAGADRSATRMAPEVVQAEGQSYRGMQDILVIPFAARDRVTVGDVPRAFSVASAPERALNASVPIYYFTHCSFASGTTAVLCYGRAIPEAGKATNGVLAANLYEGILPSQVVFQLEPIRSTTAPDAQSLALADYLTLVAATPGWSTTTDAKLGALYENFINRGNQTTSPMAGSSANVREHAKALKGQLDLLADAYLPGSSEATLRDALLERIGNPDTDVPADYPASLELPDGAAVLRWVGSGFEPQTETTTLAHINNITRYAYPAELYYYGNSRIRTSNLDDRQDLYTSGTTWDEILDGYEYNDATVSQNTQAVAVKDPMQYGVACLQVGLNQTAASVPDADGTAIAIGTANFPLTGLIVGNQHTLGFDFTPKYPDTATDTRFIYDSQVKTNGGGYFCLSQSEASQSQAETLVLQTNDGEPVVIVAEFENRGTQTFRGRDGMIYPGTRFYLVGEVEPKAAAEATEDYERRVFTQDHTTRMALTVNSLANAYNVLPDLLSPRLELGVQLTPQWVGATPVSMELE